MTSLLVTGGRGQLGVDLVAAGARAGVTVRALGSAELDVTDAAAVHAAVDVAVAAAPDRLVVVNAAAYTAVDAAETDAERARAVNVDGAAAIAAACARAGAHLLHVSTDYVFSGDADGPHGVDDPTGPRSVYGRTKLDGERAVLDSGAAAHVVRTAWLYGEHGSNFVHTMIRLAGVHDTVRVVDDQRGSPTWTADLADGLVALADVAPGLGSGVLHATNGGATTWYGLARAVFAGIGADPDRVHPCGTEEFPRPAPRPANSVLSPDSWIAAGLVPLRPWSDALTAYCEWRMNL